MPIPNRGHEAAGIANLGVIIRLMEKTIPLLGIVSAPGKDLTQALTRLAKHVPPGAVSPGVMATTIERLMLEQKQNTQQAAQMRAIPPAPPGGVPAMPGAGAPPPPQAA